MFNRVHTPIFKISASYLNSYESSHLGKRRGVFISLDLPQDFVSKFSKDEVLMYRCKSCLPFIGKGITAFRKSSKPPTIKV
jgi:hypothetical protein